MRRALLALLLAPALLHAQTDSRISGRPTAAKLVGIWQGINEIAAGWFTTYCFFADGKVVWHANQMDLDKRLYDRSGTWKLTSDGRLVTRFTQESVVVGGKWIKDFGGDGDSNIKGGTLIRRRIRHPQTQTLSLSQIARKDNYPSMKIGRERFWKFNSEPKAYN